MMRKPDTSGGYDPEVLQQVRRACLFLSTKLGGLLDELVVVGGLVPSLLVDQQDLPPGQDAHAGTMDLDLGISLGMFDFQRYQELGSHLRNAGFELDSNEQGNLTPQRWFIDSGNRVTIDFLIPSTDQTDPPGSIQHLEGDFGAVVTPGLELAFKDRRQRRLTDTIPSGARASRDIWVCGPGAFTVLKALAFGERTENKDAYDLFYVWRAIGIPEVTEGLSLLIPDPAVEQALDVIERDFSQFDGPGPIAAARFIAGGLDDEIQADVSGFAVALLRAIRGA